MNTVAHWPHPIQDICNACWRDGLAWGIISTLVVVLILFALGCAISRLLDR